MPLSSLLSDTSTLLNDQNFSFMSSAQMVRFINEARRQVAMRTGCVRRLITGQSGFGAQAMPGLAIPGAMQPGMIPNVTPGGGNSPGAVQGTLMTIPGVERYPYQGFFNPVLRETYAGVDAVINSIACSVNWGGVSRPSLDWQPWDNFQAYCRAYAVQNTSYPSVWSVFNDGEFGEVWLFPIPSMPGEIELDAICIPKAIYSDSDFDVIPPGYQNAIKYGAAAIIMETSQRYTQAAYMDAKFSERLGIGTVARDRGKTSSFYDTRP